MDRQQNRAIAPASNYSHHVEARKYDRYTSTILAFAKNKIDPSDRTKLLEPIKDQHKKILSERSRLLTAALNDHDDHEIGASIAEMLGCWEQMRRLSLDDQKKTVAKFVMELRDLPTWAVQQACVAIRTGSVTTISKNFVVSTIEVNDLARSYTDPMKVELAEIDEALSAKASGEVTPEKQKMISTGLRKFGTDLRAKTGQLSLDEQNRADLKHRTELLDAARERNNNAILREYQAMGREPVVGLGCLVSPDLAARLGLLPQNGASK
jgi:hypothetical protein